MCRTNAVRKQSGYNLYMGWYLFWSVDEMVESTPYTCNWLKFSVVVACLFWLRRLYGAFLFCWAFKPFIIAAQCQMPTRLTSDLPDPRSFTGKSLTLLFERQIVLFILFTCHPIIGSPWMPSPATSHFRVYIKNVCSQLLDEQTWIFVAILGKTLVWGKKVA